MEKNLTEAQVTTILKNAPKGTDPDKIIDGLVSRGYILQGLNDQPVQPAQEKQGVLASIGGAIIEPVERLGQGALNLLPGKDVAQRTGVFGNTVDTLGYKDGVKLQGTELAKDVAGNVLQNAASVMPVGKLGTIASGIKTGAKAGAVYGAGQGLEDQKSADGVAVSALTGAATGAVLGGATAGVLKGVKSLSTKSVPATDSFAQDLVSPKATEAVKEAALKQGRVQEPGIFKAGKILPSKNDISLAEAVKPYISEKASPIQNLNSISSGVQDINTGVKSYVMKNKVPFNVNQLKTQLNNGQDELKLIFASDSNAKKTYNAVVDEFVKHVKSKDTAGLLQARQEFDKIPAIKKLLESQGLGENTKREVVLTARAMANKYISNLLPDGNPYKAALLQETKMIEALTNIAEKNTGIIGQNELTLLTKKYPIIKAIIGGLVGGLGLGAVGVGSSVIGSSD